MTQRCVRLWNADHANKMPNDDDNQPAVDGRPSARAANGMLPAVMVRLRNLCRGGFFKETWLTAGTLTTGTWIVLSLCGCDGERTRERLPASGPAVSQPPTLAEQAARDGLHPHRDGPQGGVIASLGRDRFHAEAMVQSDGRLSIYLLGADVTQLQEAPEQELIAYVKIAGGGPSTALVVDAQPLAGDRPGMTSRWVGELPERFRGPSLSVTVPGLRIAGERFAARFELPGETAIASAQGMPSPFDPSSFDDAQADELYRTPGGLYVEADIEANGRMTAQEKYRGFRAQHDRHPQAGDRICPITKTKAHPQCRWIIGGETYTFCCPPCIDEFLARAKSDPDQILPADSYRQP